MSNPDFGLRPFAAGTVVGLRAFRVDDTNHLTGVSRRIAWTAGVNEAVCAPFSLWVTPGSTSEDHRVAGIDCSCGFYAYFANANDYAHHYAHTVTGIVEAYGTVTIGSRGFRAEKARILALVRPVDGIDFAAIIRSYPGVPVYASQAEALAAHPTTQPQDVGIDPSEAPSHSLYAMGGYIPGQVHIPAGTFIVSSSATHHIGRAIVRSFARAMQSAAEAARVMDTISKSLNSCEESLRKVEDLAKQVPAEQTPVERKRARAAAAAEQRAKAGLSNLGGINRRRRNP
ncbi:hypothetical protein GCM10009616_36030 [Microlunatus lacustris]